MVETPDEIINHKSSFCKDCGLDISNHSSTICETRQVVEIPPINPIYIEHRSYSTICTCGCSNKADFPKRVNAPIQYEETVESLVSYLNVGQYIPYNRIASMFSGLFNTPFSTVEDNFSKGFKRAVLISDRYGVHLKTKAYAHQICISHLFRDLNYLIELTGAETIKRLKALLKHAIFLKSQMKVQEYQQANFVRNFIQRERFKILSGDHRREHKKVKSLMKKLNRCRNHIFEFLHNENVPPDNNGSERAIRNVKVKQKVSTMFKSELGITNYAIIYSVFDTCTKRNIPIITGL